MMQAWAGIALAAIVMVEAAQLVAQEPAPAKPAPADGNNAPPVATAAQYDGWKVFHSNCDRCHGQDATGSSNGISEAAFASVVSDGRAEKGMPAFKSTLTEAQVGQLYAYVKARSAGTLGPGRPKPPS